MRSVRESLEAEGIEVIGADQEILPSDMVVNETSFDNIEIDRGIGAVVYGIDMSFTH